MLRQVQCVLVLEIALVLLFQGTSSGYGATLHEPETWDSGGFEGWIGEDVLNGGSAPLNNPGDRLELKFNQQGSSFPEIFIAKADVDASGGRFSGNYLSSGVISISFRLLCVTHVPDQARLYIRSGTTRRRWYYSITGLTAGNWLQFEVPLTFTAGWRLDTGPTQVRFRGDIADVEWVGLRIQRNASVGPQAYAIDDFMLIGASPHMDSDGDGMTDFAEYITGTNPHDPRSLFKIGIRPKNNGQRMQVDWPSVRGRQYEVWRSTDLAAGFGSGPILTTQAIDDVSLFEDLIPTNERVSFYFVRAKY